MQYITFLKSLIAVGSDKLPQVLALLGQIIDLVGQLGTVLGLPPSHNAAASVATEEEAVENDVLALAGPRPGEHGAIGDGTLLRNMFAFLQANPALMTLFIKLITG